MHNRYLVTESDDGMVVIDQHALHERILYEQLRERVLAGALESQALLVPEPVDLTPAEAAAALALARRAGAAGRDDRAVRRRHGAGVELSGDAGQFSPGRGAARAGRRAVGFGGKQPDRRDVLDSLLHMISCKAAIKAGDRLSGEEITALLEQRHLAQDTHHCPHGRPTALFFTREELDKQFKRT